MSPASMASNIVGDSLLQLATRTHHSPLLQSKRILLLAQAKQKRAPPPALPHARRMGPHAATWLGWPRTHRLARQVRTIPWLSRNRRHLSQVERVYLLVEKLRRRKNASLHPEEIRRHSLQRRLLPHPHRPRLDARLRPSASKNSAGEVAFNNFFFNGWAKYPNHKKDAQVVAKPIKN